MDDSVTSSNGFKVYPNQSLGKSSLLTDWRGPVYGITASSTADVRYWDITSTG